MAVLPGERCAQAVDGPAPRHATVAAAGKGPLAFPHPPTHRPAHRPAQVFDDGRGQAKGGRRARVAGRGDHTHSSGLLGLGHIAGDDCVHRRERDALAQPHGNAAGSGHETVTGVGHGQANGRAAVAEAEAPRSITGAMVIRRQRRARGRPVLLAGRRTACRSAPGCRGQRPGASGWCTGTRPPRPPSAHPCRRSGPPGRLQGQREQSAGPRGRGWVLVPSALCLGPEACAGLKTLPKAANRLCSGAPHLPAAGCRGSRGRTWRG